MRKVKYIELSKVCDLEKGKTGLMKAKEGKYTLVATGKDRRTCDTYQFNTKAVCIPLVSSTGHGHASLKYVHYQEGKFALGTILVAVIPKDETILNAQFLHLYLSRLKDIVLVPLMTGAANVTLTVTKLKTVKVPLPPIGEQLKIISLFNRMDNEQSELTSEITHQQTLLKKLRQSILQEAIEGKLTTSWREENHDVESASVLLEKIKAEKEQLVKDKKIKKQKPLPPINKDEIPFDIPDSWEWCRLGSISNINGGYAFKSDNYTDEGVRVIRISDFNESGFVNKNIVKHSFSNELEQYILSDKNIIMAMTGGTVGKSFFIKNLEKVFVTNQRVATIKVITPIIELYVYYMIQSNLIKNIINNAKNSTNDNISMNEINGFYIAFPPLKEQKEIVKKIESLFKVCNDSEEQINSSKTNSQTLMQAVLKEVFEG